MTDTPQDRQPDPRQEPAGQVDGQHVGDPAQSSAPPPPPTDTGNQATVELPSTGTADQPEAAAGDDRNAAAPVGDQAGSTARRDVGSIADAGDSSKKPRQRVGAGILAGFVAAALIGGLSGAGIATWAITANGSGQNQSTVQVPQNITVNDPANVNVITAVAAKASPSVVTISVNGGDASGTGSGIILTKDGYIVTNTHVVTLDGATSSAAIKVETTDGQLFDATLVGTDPIFDIAVIKLKDASGLTPATFGNSDKLNVGQAAIAIGAPLGLSNTVTNGIVSALNRSITIASSAVPDQNGSNRAPQDGNSPFDFWNFGNGTPRQSSPTSTISLPVIQTDAPINPGNSGGALLNANAEVIGLNVAIASASSGGNGQSGSIGVGFAIPSNMVQRITGELIKHGKASHGLLGASVYDVTEDPSVKSSTVVGASIHDVTPGGAADKAGLRPGDIVTAFNGVPIGGKTDLTAQVRVLAAGSSAPLTYLRDGKSTTVTVTVGELKQ